jgi:hypothetical protein
MGNIAACEPGVPKAANSQSSQICGEPFANIHIFSPYGAFIVADIVKPETNPGRLNANPYR